jgi:electron transfer flavoprotein alpha subunit
MNETILLLLHTEPDGSLNQNALEALELVRGLGAEFTVGLVGGSAGAAAGVVAGCGAQRFLAVEGEEFQQSRYATDAAASGAIVRAAGAQVVIAPHTSRWARALPGVAQRLGGRVDTHLSGLSADLQASRWYYRQRIEAVLSRAARPWFLLLDAGCAAAYEGAPASAALEQLTVEVTAALTRTVVTGKQAPQAGQQTIRPDASLLFVAGAGWTKKQKDGQVHMSKAADLILGFVQASQSSLGSSKSLVDLSGEGQAVLPFLSHMNQVGQTGSTPRHPKGLATCCHGEEPHVVGWRFIKERRAINLDANCGWARGKADVLYVADAFAVIERVNALLARRAASQGA